eukprot:jgi/Hompol1/5044/HPOL_000735-RA
MTLDPIHANVEYYLTLSSIGFVLPSFLFGTYSVIATPARLFGRRSSNTSAEDIATKTAAATNSNINNISTADDSLDSHDHPTFWARLLKAQANLVLVFLNVAFMGLMAVQLALAVGYWVIVGVGAYCLTDCEYISALPW